MPIRVKSRKQPGADEPPRSPSPMGQRFDGYGLPDIREDESFRELIKKLSVYVRNWPAGGLYVQSIPHTY